MCTVVLCNHDPLVIKCAVMDEMEKYVVAMSNMHVHPKVQVAPSPYAYIGVEGNS